MSKQEVRALILLHWERYPEAEPRDFYKLIYQGVFGVGHIISEKAKDFLYEEANRVDLEDYPDRELIEPASPDGRMARVYLRPFMRAGMSLDKLYKVMIKSAKIEGKLSQFNEFWGTFLEMVDAGEIRFAEGKMADLKEQIRKEGIKPRHHTEPYRNAYYPAYRVVWRQFFIEEFDLL